jgi:hypothetical protein
LFVVFFSIFVYQWCGLVSCYHDVFRACTSTTSSTNRSREVVLYYFLMMLNAFKTANTSLSLCFIASINSRSYLYNNH